MGVITLTTTSGRGSIYISGEGSGAIADQIGQAHYSYRFVEDGYRSAFEHSGLTPIKLRHPEFYSRAMDLPAFNPDCASPAIHICMRSTENLRICRPCYNVQMFAWEFDVLRTDDLFGDRPFDNQLHMLSTVDEVWTLCTYTQNVLLGHGLRNVRVVASPVKYSAPSRIGNKSDRHAALASLGDCEAHCLSINTVLPVHSPANLSAPCVLRRHRAIKRAAMADSLFVTVLNPHDFRKNMESLLIGFDAVTAAHPTAAMIVKLNIPSEMRTTQTLATILHEQLPHLTALANDRIVLVTDFLDNDALANLYRAANFYISSAFAEGQNLPLQEAMVNGCVAVSPIHTAMLDYLNEGNCVIMASNRTGLWSGRSSANHARRPYMVDRSSVVDVVRAALNALSLPETKRQVLAERGAADIETGYSIEAVAKRVSKIYDNIRHISTAAVGAVA